MKNQYVGDQNDFVKYGLIRALTDNGRHASLIAWLLTRDDLGSDGRRLSYLNTPAKWRSCDPELFDSLRDLVSRGARSVDAIASSDVLPNAMFYSDLVPRDRSERHLHFQQTLALAAGRELIFFDPDNGLEIATCPAGRTGSEKYLLWRELTDAYQEGHSLLVYQHFPREPRDEYMDRMSKRIADATGACEVFTFRSGHVVFFLAPQHSMTEFYADRTEIISTRWKDVVIPVLIAVA